MKLSFLLEDILAVDHPTLVDCQTADFIVSFPGSDDTGTVGVCGRSVAHTTTYLLDSSIGFSFTAKFDSQRYNRVKPLLYDSQILSQLIR